MLRLGYVGGRLAGRPAASAIDSLHLKRTRGTVFEPHTQEDFAINLGVLERALSRVAQSYVAQPEDIEFTVNPAQSRIARLLLGAVEPIGFASYGLNSLTTFVDRGAGDALVLIYADRPCRVTGKLDLSRTGTFVDAAPGPAQRFAGIYDHDVVLPHAGLHWLRIHPQGDRLFSVSRVEPVGPVVVVVLEAAVALAGP